MIDMDPYLTGLEENKGGVKSQKPNLKLRIKALQNWFFDNFFIISEASLLLPYTQFKILAKKLYRIGIYISLHRSQWYGSVVNLCMMCIYIMGHVEKKIVIKKSNWNWKMSHAGHDDIHNCVLASLFQMLASWEWPPRWRKQNKFFSWIFKIKEVFFKDEEVKTIFLRRWEMDREINQEIENALNI